MKEEEIKQVVRDQYSQIVEQAGQLCCSTNSCCCGANPEAEAMLAGYTKEELAQIPRSPCWVWDAATRRLRRLEAGRDRTRPWLWSGHRRVPRVSEGWAKGKGHRS